jgi:hypothetical protein
MRKRNSQSESESERSLFELQPGGGETDREVEGSDAEHWEEDSEPAFDIIEARTDGVIVLGNKKTSDRGTIMVIPGLNDSTLIEMGDLGFLRGAAQKMYEKLGGRK